MSVLYDLRQVQKRYAQRLVLDVAELEIHSGESLALVGPSGAGKSTLLRLLNFLETPDAGELRYAGQLAGPDLALTLRRQVTTVFQRPALLNDSLENNVLYGLRLRGQRDGRAEIEPLLERLGLSSLRRAPAHTLSGGEMQRAALARALLLRPLALLLDEPTANLDPYNVGLIEDALQHERRRHGMTLVVVTHNLFQARRLADRTALLLNGRVVECALTATFFESPQDERTRKFVNGEMVY